VRLVVTRIVEHSNDNGRTWRTIVPGSRSVVAHWVMNADPYEVHDDGLGNLYRWRPAEDGAR
jgi:hypothetical protein